MTLKRCDKIAAMSHLSEKVVERSRIMMEKKGREKGGKYKIYIKKGIFYFYFLSRGDLNLILNECD